MGAHRIHPMLFRHQWIICRHQMIKREQPDASLCRDAPHILRKCMAIQQMLLQSRAIANTRHQPIHAWPVNRFVHKNISTPRECRKRREIGGIG